MKCLIQKGYITIASEIYDSYFVINSLSSQLYYLYVYFYQV